MTILGVPNDGNMFPQTIKAEAVKSRLVISQLVVDFRNAVIAKKIETFAPKM